MKKFLALACFAALPFAAMSVDFGAAQEFVGADFGIMTFVDLKKAADGVKIVPDAGQQLAAAKNPLVLQSAMASALNALQISPSDAPFSCDAFAQALSRAEQILISLSADSATFLVFGDFSGENNVLENSAAFKKTDEKVGGKPVYSGENGRAKFVLADENTLAFAVSKGEFFPKKSNAKLAKYQKEFFEKWAGGQHSFAFCLSPSGAAKMCGRFFDFFLNLMDKENSLAELKKQGIDLAKYKPTWDAYFERCAKLSEIGFCALDFSIASAERFSAEFLSSGVYTSQDFADFSYDICKIFADCPIWSDLSTAFGIKISLKPSLAGKKMDCKISVSK